MYTMEGTIEQKKKYLSEILQAEKPQIRKREKWKIINNALKGQILERDYDNHVKRIQEHVDKYGIASFSRKPDDLLMFSYYAKDHAGYCLKYRRLERECSKHGPRNEL